MFYKKGINKSHSKDMWNFLKNHFQYNTMNSWNHVKSFANNVKLYNLGLKDEKKAYQITSDEYSPFYEDLSVCVFENFEDKYNVRIGFNGRSGGYLVIYDKKYSGRTIVPNMINDCSNYDEFKEYCKDYYGSVKEAMSDLRYYYEMISDFDKMCDEARNFLDNYEIDVDFDH